MIGFGAGGILALLWSAWVAAFTLWGRKRVSVVLGAVGASAGLSVLTSSSALAVGAGLIARSDPTTKVGHVAEMIRLAWTPMAALGFAVALLAASWAWSERPAVRSGVVGGVAAAISVGAGVLALIALFATWVDLQTLSVRTEGTRLGVDLAVVLVVWSWAATAAAIVAGAVSCWPVKKPVSTGGRRTNS